MKTGPVSPAATFLGSATIAVEFSHASWCWGVNRPDVVPGTILFSESGNESAGGPDWEQCTACAENSGKAEQCLK